jgi:hypothetical protein
MKLAAKKKIKTLISIKEEIKILKSIKETILYYKENKGNAYLCNIMRRKLKMGEKDSTIILKKLLPHCEVELKKEFKECKERYSRRKALNGTTAWFDGYNYKPRLKAINSRLKELKELLKNEGNIK